MKKRSPVHEGIIICLRDASLKSVHVQEMIDFYAVRDSACPVAAIPEVIAALEYRETISPNLGKRIDRAIANLQAQLAEYKTEAALESGNKVKNEARIKEEEGFKNPELPWDYTGKFTLKLRHNEFVPQKPGMILKFESEDSKIAASEVGVVVNADPIWEWREIGEIRNGENKLLWKRKRHQKSVKFPPPPQPNATELSKHLGPDQSSSHP